MYRACSADSGRRDQRALTRRTQNERVLLTPTPDELSHAQVLDADDPEDPNVLAQRQQVTDPDAPPSARASLVADDRDRAHDVSPMHGRLGGVWFVIARGMVVSRGTGRLRPSIGPGKDEALYTEVVGVEGIEEGVEGGQGMDVEGGSEEVVLNCGSEGGGEESDGGNGGERKEGEDGEKDFGRERREGSPMRRR